MTFKEHPRSFFHWAAFLRGLGEKAAPQAEPAPQLTEPTQRLRHAVHRYLRGMQLSSRKGREAAPDAPVRYKAATTHQRAPARGGLASSEALIVTRFILREVEPELEAIFGQRIQGRNVLDLDLGGFEVAWHKDLMHALEERGAIWSVSRMAGADTAHRIEHLVIPTPAADGQATLVGWFNPIGPGIGRRTDWSTIQMVGRERRPQRISAKLAWRRSLGANESEATPAVGSSLLSQFRSKGAL